MTNIEIGKRIKYARELRNTTLDDVAQIVGVAKSTVQRYETGKIQTIKLPVVESIANALNVNPAWLVGKSEKIEVPLPITTPIMYYYSLLNDRGKQEAEKRVHELTQLEEYIEKVDIIDDVEKYRRAEVYYDNIVSNIKHLTVDNIVGDFPDEDAPPKTLSELADDLIKDANRIKQAHKYDSLIDSPNIPYLEKDTLEFENDENIRE